MPIENVSDTARWVAVYRAMESERPDALFHDPFARRLAGDKGNEIVRTMKDGRSMAWAMIVRTQVIDEILIAEIASDGIDQVLNLAAGLDARPWRLALPASLRWVDVDLPEILRYKVETIGDAKPKCAYEAIATDLTDATARRNLFARIGAQSSRTLVLSEGLLIYLSEVDVGALASDLHAVPTFARWVIDLASPRLLKMMMKSWGKAVESGNAPFKFASAERHELLPRVRLGGARVLLDDGRSRASRPRDEDDVALEVPGPLLSCAHARGVPAHVRHRGARATLGQRGAGRAPRLPLLEGSANLARVAVTPEWDGARARRRVDRDRGSGDADLPHIGPRRAEASKARQARAHAAVVELDLSPFPREPGNSCVEQPDRRGRDSEEKIRMRVNGLSARMHRMSGLDDQQRTCHDVEPVGSTVRVCVRARRVMLARAQRPDGL